MATCGQAATRPTDCCQKSSHSFIPSLASPLFCPSFVLIPPPSPPRCEALSAVSLIVFIWQGQSIEDIFNTNLWLLAISDKKPFFLDSFCLWWKRERKEEEGGGRRGNTSCPAFNTNSLPQSHWPTLGRFSLSFGNMIFLSFLLISFFAGFCFQRFSSVSGRFLRLLIVGQSSQEDFSLDSVANFGRHNK